MIFCQLSPSVLWLFAGYNEVCWADLESFGRAKLSLLWFHTCWLLELACVPTRLLKQEAPGYLHGTWTLRSGDLAEGGRSIEQGRSSVRKSSNRKRSVGRRKVCMV